MCVNQQKAVMSNYSGVYLLDGRKLKPEFSKVKRERLNIDNYIAK